MARWTILRQPKTTNGVCKAMAASYTVKLLVVSLFGSIGLQQTLFAQTGNVAINSTGAAPANAALLDMREPNTADRTRGLLIPRIGLTSTISAAPVVAPAEGLMVYNTDKVVDPNPEYSVSPGFYIWDPSQRWTRYEALVRRPIMHNTFSLTATTTTGLGVWSNINGMESYTMDLLSGDRVIIRAQGTSTTSPAGTAEGLVEIAVDDGGGYDALPNGTGNTSFSLDDGSIVISGITRSRVMRYCSWSLIGSFDVILSGTYTFAVRTMVMAGTSNITTGGSTYPNRLYIETIRP